MLDQAVQDACCHGSVSIALFDHDWMYLKIHVVHSARHLQVLNKYTLTRTQSIVTSSSGLFGRLLTFWLRCAGLCSGVRQAYGPLLRVGLSFRCFPVAARGSVALLASILLPSALCAPACDRAATAARGGR